MTQRQETLLVAGSDPALINGINPFLTDKGIVVHVVDSLKDVLVTLQREDVQVLVMDVGLAQGMGCEAIPIIKGLKHRLPIIVTTHENNPELESSIRRKGIFYYHVRSFGMDELLLAISNAMARACV